MIFKSIILNPILVQTEWGKSRRDGISLTVGFNLRKQSVYINSKSRRDGILSLPCTVPAGLLGEYIAFFVRRLKPTVNDMPSLRDLLSLTQHFYKLLIFIP